MGAFCFTFLVLVLFILLLCIYFWPYFIAAKKQEDEHLAMFIINLFIAWTVIGWFICLMWAISLYDYRSAEQKEAEKDAKNAIWAFIKKHWIPILSVILVISAFAGIGSSSLENHADKIPAESTVFQTDIEIFNDIENNLPEYPADNESIGNTVSQANIEEYKKETNNFTFCELGDLVGDDVQRMKYKSYDIDFHTSDFSKKDVEKFAKECLKDGVKSQYQMDCCVRYQMYPFD